MEQVFTMLGYPDTIVSDNGTQFTSNDFEFYLQTHNIKHQLTFNRTITKTIKCILTKAETGKKPY